MRITEWLASKRIKVRGWPEYVTMHGHEPVIIEEGESGEVPEPR